MERQESFLIKRFPLIVLFYFIAFFIIRVYIGGALERGRQNRCFYLIILVLVMNPKVSIVR